MKVIHIQGWFWAYAQPMRDVITNNAVAHWMGANLEWTVRLSSFTYESQVILPCRHWTISVQIHTHISYSSLWWRHNGRDSVSNHQPHDCLLNCIFRRKLKKTSKLRATGLCRGEFTGDRWIPAQMASNAGNVSIWWRHRVNHQCASVV